MPLARPFFLFIWHLTFSNSLSRSPVWEKESKKGRERQFYSVRRLIGVLKDGNHCEMQIKTNTDSESGFKINSFMILKKKEVYVWCAVYSQVTSIYVQFLPPNGLKYQ